MQSKQVAVVKAINPNGWIWSTWLKECPPSKKYTRFSHIEFIEDDTKRPSIENDLVSLLNDYHTYLPIDINLLARLRYRQLASVLANSLDQRPQNWKTRSGNFLEILACELVKARGYDVPVFRLQYNPNNNQSMKGDDILGFRFADNKTIRSMVMVGEGKFRADGVEEAVKEAYIDLMSKVHAGPISMEFVATILSRNGDHQKAAQVMQSRRQLFNQDSRVVQKFLLCLGTIRVNRPKDPFAYLESYSGNLVTNLIAVDIVFKKGFQDWINRIYEKEYKY